MTPMTDEAMAKANEIRSRAEAQYEQIRNDSRLSDSAKQSSLAAALLQARSDMAELQQTVSANIAMTVDAATAQAFGINDLVGNDPSARAQYGISLRDAMDRADSITSPQDATTMLTRANDTGDEPLARAVGRRAFTMAQDPLAGAAWGDVVEAFTATRPDARQAVETLASTPTNSTLSAADMFGWVVVTPSEMTGVNDYRLQAMAEA